MMCRHRRLFVLLAATIVCTAALPQLIVEPSGRTSAKAVDEDSWLFIAYMSADEPGAPLNWSADINEMESGLLSQNITVIALVDPPGVGDSRVYKIARDARDTDSIVSATLAYPPLGAGGEANMSDPGTLTDFAEFAIDGYYQGGRVGVILWGHGNGWMGVCLDNGDYLEPGELAQAIGATSAHLGKPLDLVIFDACSMSSFEVLPLLAGAANYSVSSEIQVPEYGFPYDSALKGVSADISMSTRDVARIFADEYIEYGALVAGVTSQAAVVDLAALGEAADGLQGFCDEGLLFMPLVKPVLEDLRNASYGIGGGSSVDLLNYLAAVVEDNATPRRFSDAADELREAICNSTAFDRVFVSPQDYGALDQDSFQGLSIYFPNISVQMDDYRNSSGLAASWADFLDILRSGVGYTIPQPSLSLTMQDLRYGDGLNDSVSFAWTQTPEIDKWSCDAMTTPGSVEGRLNFSDSAGQSGTLGNLTPGYYEVYAYGIAADGKYRYYEKFDDVTIMRRFTFNVHLPEIVSEGDINITNLRTGTSYTSPVSGDSAVVSFVVPTPFNEGDRLLLSLERDNVTIARGFVVLSGDATDIYLAGVSQPTAISSLFLFILVAALIVTSFIILRNTGRSRSRKKPKERGR
jgi:hypothetical protein